MSKINFDKLSYREIEQRYIDNNIQGQYRFRNAEEVKDVFGWDFRSIRGMKELSEADEELAEKLICNYLNGWGLGQRHEQRPMSIKKESKWFKVTFKDNGYSYLYFNGSIG
ncbi:hypothetical protein [Clostridium gasigenes]|uniref:Uncharacterized protein n=1 Tax=Clostridium gasigenes TaxID=94869 RepID=A0A1H0M5E2_9CLOT|nr:hypothetical protein [Clostridium gasigenes]SDO75669.1 hypothetical protein SAMN04488529_101329 [Clostridium gasigenes]